MGIYYPLRVASDSDESLCATVAIDSDGFKLVAIDSDELDGHILSVARC